MIQLRGPVCILRHPPGDMRTNLVQPSQQFIFIQHSGSDRKFDLPRRLFKCHGRVVEDLELNVRVLPFSQIHQTLTQAIDGGRIVFIERIEALHFRDDADRLFAPAQVHENQSEVLLGEGVHRIEEQELPIHRFGFLIAPGLEERVGIVAVRHS